MSRQRFNKKQKHQNNSSNDNNVVNMDNYITRKKSVVLIPRNLNQETYLGVRFWRTPDGHTPKERI